MILTEPLHQVLKCDPGIFHPSLGFRITVGSSEGCRNFKPLPTYKLMICVYASGKAIQYPQF